MKFLIAILIACGCASAPAPVGRYHDNTGRDDVWTGGVKQIAVTTPSGTFRVWTKRVGNNPSVKVLLLNGGPGFTHEYLEVFDSYLPGAGVEYYYYDQLDSGNSDRPGKPALWDLARYVEEVEQVRVALGLDTKNFVLYGHSWGGLLAIEYALKYQQHLRGLVISNMMSSIPAYNEYASKVLIPKIDPKVVSELRQLEADNKYEDARYFELLMPSYYQEHVLRKPPAEWPEPVLRSFGRVNKPLYVAMQGPSEMGASGALVQWDRFADLPKITVPTLVIAGSHDTMDPTHMKNMAGALRKGRFVLCPEGGHMAMYDDQATYFRGLLGFLADLEQGRL
ncbi:MAG: proline iminopeptidase-family hydrolase [Kofleriaceae bacterium]